jgi:hypothetical protein
MEIASARTVIFSVIAVTALLILALLLALFLNNLPCDACVLYVVIRALAQRVTM